MMLDVLEIEFKGRRKEFAANPMQFPFAVGEPAIVDVERGLDLGKISHLGWRGGMQGSDNLPYRVLRRATTADLRVLDQNRDRELEAKRGARKKVGEHHLDMKVVDVELQWDGRKMTFYFTAEGRVDFRELVKDLATTFRTRIDLRQIGARDETKRTNGYGICGRPLCCATFLSEFKPITTQMPRDQFLPLNPSKLSGVCGRLKCCLRYELDVYRDFQRSCPKVGHPVKDESKQEGVIDKLDVMREQIQIRFGDGTVDKYSREEFLQISNWKPEMPRSECICTCGRKPATALPKPQAVKSQIETAPESVEGAEKITLLAGGGLGMQAQDGSGEVRFGQNVDATPKSAEPTKKKRRRRRKKKPGSGAVGGAATGPAPAQAGTETDDDDDGDEE
ncbi:stage 0 sporulation protein [candidate division KSB1 bacterium]|nr:stage 0 sporulation protein [candidate division KSB1 bacterium]